MRSQTVLVVENDRQVLDAIADAIRDTGRRVFTAQDGEEALSLLGIDAGMLSSDAGHA